MLVMLLSYFFEINDINLNTRNIKRFFPQDESDRYSADRPYSMDEIIQILDKCDIRSRVIILLMASTGMRLGALHMDEEGRPGIRVGDLKKFDEFGLYMISVYPWSKSDRYYTFCILSRAQIWLVKVKENANSNKVMLQTKVSLVPYTETSTAGAIINYAEQNHIDLIVIGYQRSLSIKKDVTWKCSISGANLFTLSCNGDKMKSRMSL